MDSDLNGYLEYPRGGEESVEIAHYSFQIGRNGGSTQSFNDYYNIIMQMYTTGYLNNISLIYLKHASVMKETKFAKSIGYKYAWLYYVNFKSDFGHCLHKLFHE